MDKNATGTVSKALTLLSIEGRLEDLLSLASQTEKTLSEVARFFVADVESVEGETAAEAQKAGLLLRLEGRLNDFAAILHENNVLACRLKSIAGIE